MTIQELRLHYHTITKKETIHKCVEGDEVLVDEYARFIEKQLCKIYNERVKILDLLKE